MLLKPTKVHFAWPTGRIIDDVFPALNIGAVDSVTESMANTSIAPPASEGASRYCLRYTRTFSIILGWA